MVLAHIAWSFFIENGIYVALVLVAVAIALRKKVAAGARAVSNWWHARETTSAAPVVVAAERADVIQRRAVVFPPPAGQNAAGDATDPVGLALSGGGIRSAMFNLGLIQALHEFGLYRYLDYLSTVSGGSYLGAHLASQMQRLRQTRAAGDPVDPKADFPLQPEPNGSQPERVRRFIRRGDYLDRPWEIVLAYSFGLLCNLALFGSALVFLAALLACSWRWFDQPSVLAHLKASEENTHRFLPFIWFTPDLFRAFIPFVLLGFLWFLTWLVARLTARWTNYNEESRWARKIQRVFRFFRTFCGVSFLVGFIVLLGNGDVSLGPVRHALPDTWLIYNNDSQQNDSLDFDLLSNARRSVLQGALAVFGTLILVFGIWPMLRPAPLPNRVPAPGDAAAPNKPLARGRSGSKILSLLAIALLMGVPLGLLYALARENVSGKAATGKIVLLQPQWGAEDRNVPQTLALRLYSRRAGEQELRERLKGSEDDEIGVRSEVLRWLQSGSRKAPALKSEERGLLRRLPNWFDGAAAPRAEQPVIDAASQVPTVTDPQLVAIEIRFSQDPYDWFLNADFFLTPRWADSPEAMEGVNRLPLTAWMDRKNKSLWLRLDSGAALPGDLDRFALDLIVSKDKEEDRHLGIVAANRLNIVRSAECPPFPPEDVAWSDRFLKPGPTLLGLAGIDMQKRGSWVQEKRSASLGQQLAVAQQLSSLAEEDQYFRLRILCAAFWLFLGCGTLVSLNWTSMHAFYRERLREAYIEPLPRTGRHIPLSEIATASEGAPYLLMSGTLNLLGDYRATDRTWPFLFSSRYCGSDVTGYVSTRSYLSAWLRGRDDLAEVAAISGAAISPSQAKGLPLLLLMGLANLRLGQWLPHPVNALRPWLVRNIVRFFSKPALLFLGPSFFWDAEDRGRCLITDGGHSENLGLLPLLQRRCKLIIVSDAGEDPEHAFDDFMKVCRRVRLYHGLHIVDLHDNQPLDLKPLALQPNVTCLYHFFIGRIQYPGDFMRPGGNPRTIEEGFIIYLKPSLTNDEDNDLLRHFRHRQPFPHDPTVNQLFDQDTVESYRQLGHHIGKSLCRHLPANIWDNNVRHNPTDLFWQFLSRGPRHEVYPVPEDDPLLRPLPAGSRDAARALRRYDADTVTREVAAAEILQLLSRHHRRGTWHGSPLRLSPAVLVEWAIACNNRALRNKAPAPARFLAGGREDLLRLALQFCQVVAVPVPGDFFEQLAEFAVALAGQVFAEDGAETARYLLVCLLTVNRFQPSPGLPAGELLDLLEDRDTHSVANFLQNWYHPTN